jgi:hypothetical protein
MPQATAGLWHAAGLLMVSPSASLRLAGNTDRRGRSRRPTRRAGCPQGVAQDALQPQPPASMASLPCLNETSVSIARNCPNSCWHPTNTPSVIPPGLYGRPALSDAVTTGRCSSAFRARATRPRLTPSSAAMVRILWPRCRNTLTLCKSCCRSIACFPRKIGWLHYARRAREHA